MENVHVMIIGETFKYEKQILDQSINNFNDDRIFFGNLDETN